MIVGEGLTIIRQFDFAFRTCSKAYHAIEASAWRAGVTVAILVFTITSTARNRSVLDLWKPSWLAAHAE